MNNFIVENKANLINQEIIQSNSNDKLKPNIYFFILDAMKPLNEFEKFYEFEKAWPTEGYQRLLDVRKKN